MTKKEKTDPYRRIAGFYDVVVEPFNKALRRYVVKAAQPSQGMKVLEVGCGTGANLALFADKGCKITGVDLSPSMIDVARRKLGESADLRIGDAADMPFSDCSFDLVVSFLTLHEMPAPVRLPVAAEMARVVRRNGRLLMVDFHPGPYRFPKGWIYRGIIVPIEIAAGREHFRNHRDFLQRNGLPALIDGNGLTVEKEKFVAGGNIQILIASPAST